MPQFDLDKNSADLYFRQIAKHLRRLVRENYFSSRRVFSINEIVANYGVGRETAKKALVALEDEGIIRRVQGKGSIILDRNETALKRCYLFLPIHAEFYLRMTEVFRSSPNIPTEEIYYGDSTRELENRIAAILDSSDVKPVFCIVPPFIDIEGVRRIAERYSDGTNMLLIDVEHPAIPLPQVVQDHAAGTILAADRLLAETDGSIVFLYNEYHDRGTLILERMEAAFRGRAGSREVLTAYNHKDLSKQRIKADRIGGVFCLDDIEAMLLIGYLRDQGIDVPRRIKVVGYNNNPIGRYFTPPLTTVDGNHASVARGALELIDRADSGNLQSAVVRIPPALVVRVSG